MSEYSSKQRSTIIDINYYDEIPISTINEYPLTLDKLMDILQRYAPTFMHWDTSIARKLRFKLYIPIMKKTERELKFETIDDFLNYINSKLPVDTALGKFLYDSFFYAYEEVDAEIPPIAKMWGTNMLYSLSRGRDGVKQPNRNTATNRSGGFSIFNDIMHQVFLAFWGEAITPTEFDSSAKGSKAIWLGADINNLFGLPRFKPTVGVIKFHMNTGSVNRYYYHLVNHQFEQYLHSGATESWEMDDIRFVGYSMENNDFRILQNNKTDKVQLAKDSIDGTYSYCVVYKTHKSDEPEKVAVHMKPIGINDIITNYIDFDVYDLEVLGKEKNRQQLVYIRSFEKSADVWFTNSIRCLTGIRIRGIIPTGKYVNADKVKLSNSVQIADIYFRLRHKKSGRVSKLSSCKLVSELNGQNGLNPFGFRIVPV